jgi:adenine-specific DNA-methyltransferase
VVREFGEPIFPGIKRLDSIRRGGDKPGHIVLNAENHHALQLLLYAYEGRVDCIYIDPPFNSGGARDWKYNNNYVGKDDNYRHSKWLSFMDKRLRRAKRE